MSSLAIVVDDLSSSMQQFVGNSTEALIASYPTFSNYLSETGPMGLFMNVAIALQSAFFLYLFQRIVGFISSRFMPGYDDLVKSVRDFEIKWQVCVTGTLFCIVTSVVATFLLYLSKHHKESPYVKDITERRIFGYSRPAEIYFSFASGWFIYDLIICLRYIKVYKPVMVAHGVSGLAVAMITTQFSTYYGLHGALFEVSTIFMNISEMIVLYSGGKRDSLLAKVALLIFIASFAKWRIFNSLWPFTGFTYGIFADLIKVVMDMNVKDYTQGNNPSILFRSAIVFFSYALLNCLSLFWFTKMVFKVILELIGAFSTQKAASLRNILLANRLTKHFLGRDHLDGGAKVKKID